MSRIEALKRNYYRVCYGGGLPWDRNLAGPQRVWFAVYDKEDERKLRSKIDLFAEATHAAGHRWHRSDLTDAFADWLSSPPYSGYSESYFESPELLDDGPLTEFRDTVARKIIDILESVPHAEDTVVALNGVALLFGFLRISEVLPLVESRIRGRLLVFFPGVYEQDNYRLLDARDGWNYHAVPITPAEGDSRR